MPTRKRNSAKTAEEPATKKKQEKAVSPETATPAARKAKGKRGREPATKDGDQPIALTSTATGASKRGRKAAAEDTGDHDGEEEIVATLDPSPAPPPSSRKKPVLADPRYRALKGAAPNFDDSGVINLAEAEESPLVATAPAPASNGTAAPQTKKRPRPVFSDDPTYKPPKEDSESEDEYLSDNDGKKKRPKVTRQPTQAVSASLVPPGGKKRPRPLGHGADSTYKPTDEPESSDEDNDETKRPSKTKKVKTKAPDATDQDGDVNMESEDDDEPPPLQTLQPPSPVSPKHPRTAGRNARAPELAVTKEQPRPPSAAKAGESKEKLVTIMEDKEEEEEAREEEEEEEEKEKIEEQEEQKSHLKDQPTTQQMKDDNKKADKKAPETPKPKPPIRPREEETEGTLAYALHKHKKDLPMPSPEKQEELKRKLRASEERAIRHEIEEMNRAKMPRSSSAPAPKRRRSTSTSSFTFAAPQDQESRQAAPRAPVTPITRPRRVTFTSSTTTEPRVKYADYVRRSRYSAGDRPNPLVHGILKKPYGPDDTLPAHLRPSLLREAEETNKPVTREPPQAPVIPLSQPNPFAYAWTPAGPASQLTYTPQPPTRTVFSTTPQPPPTNAFPTTPATAPLTYIPQPPTNVFITIPQPSTNVFSTNTPQPPPTNVISTTQPTTPPKAPTTVASTALVTTTPPTAPAEPPMESPDLAGITFPPMKMVNAYRSPGKTFSVPDSDSPETPQQPMTPGKTFTVPESDSPPTPTPPSRRQRRGPGAWPSSSPTYDEVATIDPKATPLKSGDTTVFRDTITTPTTETRPMTTAERKSWNVFSAKWDYNQIASQPQTQDTATTAIQPTVVADSKLEAVEPNYPSIFGDAMSPKLSTPIPLTKTELRQWEAFAAQIRQRMSSMEAGKTGRTTTKPANKTTTQSPVTTTPAAPTRRVIDTSEAGLRIYPRSPTTTPGNTRISTVEDLLAQFPEINRSGGEQTQPVGTPPAPSTQLSVINPSTCEKKSPTNPIFSTPRSKEAPIALPVWSRIKTTADLDQYVQRDTQVTTRLPGGTTDTRGRKIRDWLYKGGQTGTVTCQSCFHFDMLRLLRFRILVLKVMTRTGGGDRALKLFVGGPMRRMAVLVTAAAAADAQENVKATSGGSSGNLNERPFYAGIPQDLAWLILLRQFIVRLGEVQRKKINRRGYKPFGQRVLPLLAELAELLNLPGRKINDLESKYLRSLFQHAGVHQDVDLEETTEEDWSATLGTDKAMRLALGTKEDWYVTDEAAKWCLTGRGEDPFPPTIPPHTGPYDQYVIKEPPMAMITRLAAMLGIDIIPPIWEPKPPAWHTHVEVDYDGEQLKERKKWEDTWEICFLETVGERISDSLENIEEFGSETHDLGREESSKWRPGGAFPLFPCVWCYWSGAHNQQQASRPFPRDSLSDAKKRVFHTARAGYSRVLGRDIHDRDILDMTPPRFVEILREKAGEDVEENLLRMPEPKTPEFYTSPTLGGGVYFLVVRNLGGDKVGNRFVLSGEADSVFEEMERVVVQINGSLRYRVGMEGLAGVKTGQEKTGKTVDGVEEDY